MSGNWLVHCIRCGYLDSGWPRSGPAFAVRQLHLDLNPDHLVIVCTAARERRDG